MNLPVIALIVLGHRPRVGISTAAPLDGLKNRHFPSHATKPVVLHRRDILRRCGPFALPDDGARREASDADLLQLFREQRYMAIVIVIDKAARNVKGAGFYQDPYHFALALMLERFCGFLRFWGRVGNVVVEARGKPEDQRLLEAYQSVYDEGTHFHDHKFFRRRLRSRKPAFRDKGAFVTSRPE